MATKQSSSAKYLKECPVCLDDMVNKTPKLLDCKHSFCISCISRLAVAHGAVGLKVPCPKCKHDTEVKSGKLADLPDNFLLNEFKAALDDRLRQRICSYCHKQDKETDAVSQCTKCHTFMCNDCTQKHEEYFSSHEIVSMVDGEHQERCKAHNEAVVYVCCVCSPSRLLCDVCIMKDGPCHSKKDLADYTQVLKEEETKLKSSLDQQDKVHICFTKWKDRVMTDMSSIIEMTTQVTWKIERYSNIKAMESATEMVIQEGKHAQKLLKSDTRQLADIQKANKLLTKALTDFGKEEQRGKFFGTDTELKSKMNEVLENLKQVLDHMLSVRPRLMASFPTADSVSKLKASTGGRVLYVCEGGTSITEVASDGKMRHMETGYFGRGGISYDRHENSMFFSCFCYPLWRFFKCELSKDFNEDLPSCLSFKPIYQTIAWGVVDLCHTTTNKIMVVQEFGKCCIYNVSTGLLKEQRIPFKDEYIQLTTVKNADRPGFIATYISHKTVLYHDEDGKVLHTICQGGPHVAEPKATTISVMGNILVADSGAGKIVELTLQGEFVRDVLTREDGLHKPVNVAYSHPFLWVADQTDDKKYCLKCYEVGDFPSKY